MSRVLNVLLSHQPPEDLAPVLRLWENVAGSDGLLLAFGGSREHYDHAAFEPRVFLDDPRLRTRDHQREHQSMTAVYRTVTEWLANSGVAYEFVYFTEFDHLPLVADLNARQIRRLEVEQADVLAFHLQRIDGTNHPHYLYHVANPGFRQWLRSVSVRFDREVVLSMLGTGSFWRRDAFEAIGTSFEPGPIYFELYVPTLAHHLGFRVRDWNEQNRYVRSVGSFGDQIEAWCAEGAWTIHPVKQLPPHISIPAHA